MILNAQEIKDACNLVDIVSKYVDLKREGSNLVGLSPFKDENTPSFKVSPAKRLYKCFASGKGGNDAVQFLRDLKGITYPEALEELAETYGIAVNYGNGNPEAERAAAKERKALKEKMVDAIKKAHDFFIGQSSLLGDKELIEIAGKSYSSYVISKWGMTTAGDYDALPKASESWPDRQLLVDAGILALKKNGTSFYNFFANRLLFPLYSESGDIIGYNGRLLDYDKADPKKKVKYLNSPDTILYNKGKHVFGYWQNYKNIRDKGFAYIVEGPTDVIQMDMAGVNNAVCCDGHSLSEYQARYISRATDTVIFMYDNDGTVKHETLKNNIMTMLPTQVECKVLFLPEGYDPGQYFSEFSKDDFSNISAEDAIEYLIRTELPNPKDCGPHEQGAATILAANLIAEIEDQAIQRQYVNRISKMINATSAALMDHVKEVLKKRTEKKNRLTPEQEMMKAMYGFYIDKNKYYHQLGFELSNFIVEPLFLVRESDKSYRVMKVINTYGISEIIKVESDEFITLAGFKKKTEMLGNFIFTGKEEHYTKIKSLIYSSMYNVHPIDVLGYHPAGFYAFSNCIISPEGKVIDIDENGIVEYEGKKYFLPTFSNVGFKDEYDAHIEDEFEQSFRYVSSEEAYTIKSYSHKFAKIFGRNAVIGLSYYFAATYRDMLFRRFDCFPHLNLFGPAGSGKTFMARALTSLYGIPVKPTHSVNGSVSAFFRRMAQSRNAITPYEEYSEKVPEEKLEGFKNFFDGFGRTLSKLSNDTKTRNTPVYNACLISGQVMPNHDPALMERVVTLFFDKIKASDSERKEAERFIAIGKKGHYSQVTAELHSLREHVMERFETKLDDVREYITGMFNPANMPQDRVLNNYSMITAMYFTIMEKVDLPFKPNEVYDMVYERIVDQTKSVEGAEEISGWWSMIEYLMEKGDLTSAHYACEWESHVRIEDPDNKEKSKIIEFDEKKKLLFVRMNYAHKEYQRQSKVQSTHRVLELNTLQYYLRIHKSYLGICKGKKIGGTTQRVWVFDTAQLQGYEFKQTYFDQNDPPLPENPYEGMRKSEQTEIPF